MITEEHLSKLNKPTVFKSVAFNIVILAVHIFLLYWLVTVAPVALAVSVMKFFVGLSVLGTIGLIAAVIFAKLGRDQIAETDDPRADDRFIQTHQVLKSNWLKPVAWISGGLIIAFIYFMVMNWAMPFWALLFGVDHLVALGLLKINKAMVKDEAKEAQQRIERRIRRAKYVEVRTDCLTPPKDYVQAKLPSTTEVH